MESGKSTSALDLEDDDEVTDESAFIFDPSSNVMALQRNKQGLSRKGVEVYLSGHQSLAEPIVLKPLTKAATLSRLARMSHTTKLVVKIAQPQESSRNAPSGSSTNEAIEILNRLNAPTLRIEASAGRTDGVLTRAKEFVRDLIARDERNEIDVHTLQITGEIESEPAFIDLIEDKLIAEVSVEANERRTLPYPNRRSSLRVAWNELLNELRAYGVTS